MSHAAYIVIAMQSFSIFISPRAIEDRLARQAGRPFDHQRINVESTGEISLAIRSLDQVVPAWKYEHRTHDGPNGGPTTLLDVADHQCHLSRMESSLWLYVKNSRRCCLDE